jgi:heptosyltransferase-2
MHANQPYRGRFLPLIRLFDGLTVRVRRGWGLDGGRRPDLMRLRPRRILVLESHLIGDQVLALPLLEALAAAYPQAELHVLANPWLQELVSPLPEHWVFHPCWIPWSSYDHRWRTWRALCQTIRSLRRLQFDLALDVRGDLRNLVLLAATGAVRRVGFGAVSGGRAFLTDSLEAPPEGGHLTEGHRAVLRALGCPDAPYVPTLRPDPGQTAWARSRLQELGLSSARTLGIHPGASQADRRIPEKKLVEIIQGARSAGWQPLLLGGHRESPLLEGVRAAMPDPPPVLQAPLPGFVALCGELGHLLTMDSGPAHISAAVGCGLTVLIQAEKVRTTAPLAGRGSLTLVAYEGAVAGLPVVRILDVLGPCPRRD